MPHRATYILVFLAVHLFAGRAVAQEHPFLSTYSLTELPNGVLVNWTIYGGSTCDGQQVERSTDSLSFVTVHTIQGICGSPESSTPYTWFDPSPPELSKVFYRLKLGFDGYSSVKSVLFQQLNESVQRLFPNPVEAATTLVINVPLNTAVDLHIRNSTGSVVWERLAQPGPSIEMNLNALSSGLYFYQAEGNGRTFNGKFVKR